MMNILVALLSSLLLEYVNPFVGTDAHGHTFPGAAYPFGMVQLSPDTRPEHNWDGCSGYHYSDEYIYGFSHTHLSGTGCADLCDVLLMPTIGYRPEKRKLDRNVYRSVFSHDSEIATPGFYEVVLGNTGIRTRLTVGERVGMHEYTFPRYSTPQVILDLNHRDALVEWSISRGDAYSISGHRKSNSWAKGQDIYFWMEFSEPVASYAECDGGAVIGFNRSHDNIITVRVGISSVSEANARENLKSEYPRDFESLQRSTERVWERVLMKTPCPDTDPEANKVFYTALYHCCIHPSLYSDANGEYRGMDHKVHKAVTPEGKKFKRYTVFSLWDTFRGLHPLLSRIEPERTVDFLRSFQSIFDEAGKLPVWELWGYETNCMIGFNSAPVIADALQAGIGERLLPIEVERLFDALVETSMKTGRGLGSFRKNGLVLADDESQSVSRTLEYAYDDWCVAQVAEWLLKKPGTCRLHSRARIEQYRDSYLHSAQYWRNVFDPSTGFMRARLNGRFVTPFDPCEVSSNYTEANPWQYSFFVPQDIAGLIKAHGGKEAFEHMVDGLFSASEGSSAHKLADITGLIGQYAHGNEPSHHIAYLYDYIDRHDKAEATVGRIMEELYSSAPDGLCGNEDCGQMSAWYVLGALGEYPVCPGAPERFNPKNGTVPEATGLPDDIVVNPVFEMEEDVFADSVEVAVNPLMDGVKVWWRTGNGEFREYEGPSKLYCSGTLEAYSETADGRRSFVTSGSVHKIHTDRKVYILSTVSSQYSAGGEIALRDDVRGKPNWKTGGWMGCQGCDFEAVMDLLEPREIHDGGAGFCQDAGKWIWMPTEVEFSWSMDGEQYFFLDRVVTGVNPRDNTVRIHDYGFTAEPMTITIDWSFGEGDDIETETMEIQPVARYIRMKARTLGTIPEWHPGAGGEAFIFVDEFYVN